MLGGLAGSGKTEVLRALGERGEQIIDLEGLAHHRGSAFGHLGQPPQPSHERFQALVETAIRDADARRPLWVEEEGPFLGSVGVPLHLSLALERAPTIVLDVPRSRRVQRLLSTYGGCDPATLAEALERLSGRLGRQRTRAALKELWAGRVREAIEIVLDYYDGAYRHRTAAWSERRVALLRVDEEHAEQVAEMLRATAYRGVVPGGFEPPTSRL